MEKADFMLNRSSSASASEEEDQIHKDSPRESKRKRKTETRLIKEIKITPGKVLEEDGFIWRKYGQKEMFGHKYPRYYYRCAHRLKQSCLATKTVHQRDVGGIFQICYNGSHTCTQASSTSCVDVKEISCAEIKDPLEIGRLSNSVTVPHSDSCITSDVHSSAEGDSCHFREKLLFWEKLFNDSEDYVVGPEEVKDAMAISYDDLEVVGPEEVKDAMAISYDDLEEKAGRVVHVADWECESLPDDLKWLFLYCSLFPPGYEFRKDELVQLWMAEGFIGEDQRERMEDIGSVFFNSLETKGFFVPSRNDFRVDFDSVFSVPIYNSQNFLYKVNPIKLPILENTISEGEFFRAVYGNLDGASEMTQHLSLICEDISEMTFGVLQKFKHLHTLLLLSGCGSSIKKVPRNLFLSLKLLRTLNLSQTLISELPSSIGNVKSLRYLDVSHTPITWLPESIGSLHNLQTIKLRGCIHLVQLPKSMKNLTNLQHIEFDIIRQLVSMPSHLGNLTNLQTLSAFLVGRADGCGIAELKNLNDLKGALRISRLENVLSKDEAKEAALIDKKWLDKLELRWSNSLAENAEEVQILECLEPHSGLKELQILSYSGSILPTWISNPSFADLVVITLYGCKNCKLLPSIGQLPALKFLYIIEMNEVKEINHQFFRNDQVQVFPAFPKLERLEVDIMLNLKEWTEVQIGDLPSLLELTVDSCPKLVTLPSLSCLKSLKHLEFRGCPKLLSLPSDGLPTSLESFIIIDCPELKEQCRKREGQDWGNMRVWFDHEEVLDELE